MKATERSTIIANAFNSKQNKIRTEWITKFIQRFTQISDENMENNIITAGKSGNKYMNFKIAHPKSTKLGNDWRWYYENITCNLYLIHSRHAHHGIKEVTLITEWRSIDEVDNL